MAEDDDKIKEMENVAVEEEKKKDSDTVKEISQALEASNESHSERAVSYAEKHVETAQYYDNIGTSYVQEGRLDDAIDSYKHALKIEPENPEVLHHLGDVYVMKNDLRSAAHCYSKAHEAKDNNEVEDMES